MPGNSLVPAPGLFKSRIMRINDTDIVISETEWDRLAETAEPIGECRNAVPHWNTELKKQTFVACDGTMFAEPSPDYQVDEDPIHWQGARCNVCGYEVAIPNRRVLRRSSAHGAMPQGYFQDRERRLRPAEPRA